MYFGTIFVLAAMLHSMWVWEKCLNCLWNVSDIGIYNGKYLLVYVDHFIYAAKRNISYIILYFFFFQLFYSFFKSLVGKDVVVELKNDLR